MTQIAITSLILEDQHCGGCGGGGSSCGCGGSFIQGLRGDNRPSI